LKFCPTKWHKDDSSLGRFAVKGKGRFALKHPNICTKLHEINEQGWADVHRDGVSGLGVHTQEPHAGDAIEDGDAAGVLSHPEVSDAWTPPPQRKVLFIVDIKPIIFITKRGHAKILDFGWPKFAPMAEKPTVGGGPQRTPRDSHELMHKPGAAVGNRSLHVPEQAKGRISMPAPIIYFGTVRMRWPQEPCLSRGENFSKHLGDGILKRTRCRRYG